MSKKHFLMKLQALDVYLNTTLVKPVKGRAQFIKDRERAVNFVDSFSIEPRLMRQIYNELVGKFNDLLQRASDKNPLT